MALNMKMGYHDEYGNLVNDPSAVWRHYLRRPTRFGLDVVAAVPLELIGLAWPLECECRLSMLSYIRLVHLLRFYHIKRYFSESEQGLNVKSVYLLHFAADSTYLPL
jgi:hypothetical protein